MASLQDYLEGSPLFDTKKEEEYKRLLSGIAGYQTNRAAGEALGLEDLTAEPDRGIVSRLLGGASTIGKVIDYPAKIARNIIPFMEGRTGGEIIKTNRGDSVLERGLKGLAAFGIDVATDPLTWVGAPGSLGRKFAASTVVDPKTASRLLGVAEDATRQAGRNADEITDLLANRGVQARVATMQKEVGLEAAEKTARDLFDLADPKVRQELASEELGRVIGSSLMLRGRGAVTQNLTNIFGDAKIAKRIFEEMPDVARGGIYLVNPVTGKPITRIAGGKGRVSAAADLANRARFGAASGFGELGYRLTGGAGLAGRFGPAWQDVNRGLKYAVSDPSKLIKVGMTGTTLPAFMALKSIDRAAQALRHSLYRDAQVALDRAPAARLELDEASRAEFDASFKDAFQFPNKPLETISPVAARGAEEARVLRQTLDQWRDKAVQYGVDISDLGPGYTSLMYTDEAWTKALDEMPRGAGIKNTDLRYRTSAPRSEWILDIDKQPNQWKKTLQAAGVDETLEIDDAIARVGFRLPDGRVALAPSTINKYLRSIGELGADELRFLEDPSVIMQRYMESMSSRIAAQKLVNDGLKAGILFADPMTLAKQTRMMGDFIEGMRKVSPEVARRAEIAIEGRRQALVQQATTGSREALDEAKAVQGQARARYNVAKDQESAVVVSLREVTADVDRLRREAGNISPMLRQYGKEGKEELAEQLVRSRKNVKARLKRAQESLKESKQVQRNAQKRLDRVEAKAITVEDRASDLLFEAETLWDEIVLEGAEPVLLQNYRKLEELLASADDDVAKILAKENLEESLLDEARAVVLAKTNNVATSRNVLADTVSELDSVRTTAASLRETLSEQQRQTIARFEDALTRRSRIEQQLQDAVTIRNEFRPAATRLGRRISLESAQALDVLAMEYSEAFKAVAELSTEYNALRKAGLDTSDVKMRLDAARKTRDASKKALTSSIGSWGGKESAIANYRKSLVSAAQKLASEELAVARIIMDDGRLDDLLTQAGSVSGRNLEAVSADLQEMFYNIRDRLTMEEYQAFKDAASVLQTAPVRSNLPLITDDAKITEFGRFLNENDMKMIGSGIEGGSVNVPGSLSNLHASRGIREFLENAYRVNNNPDSIKGFFAQVYDPLLLLWKTGVTVGRGPSYVLTNTIGGMYMNHLAGVSAKTHKEAGKALMAINEAAKKAERELPNATRVVIQQRADELAAEALEGLTIAGIPAVDIAADYFSFGGREATQTREFMEQLSRQGIAVDPRVLTEKSPAVKARFAGEPTGKGDEVFRKVIEFGLTNKVQTKFNDWAQSSEMFLRMAAYADGVAKYGSKDTAWDQMVSLHFDYQNLSDAEQKIRRLMPFYTWTRNNVPAQVRALFLQPGKIRRFLYAREEFKNAFGTEEENGWMNQFLPEYVSQVGGFATMIGGGTPLAFMGRLPFDDLERLMTPVVNTKELTQMLGPWQAGIDILSGMNSTTGQKFNPQGERAGGYLSLLAKLPFVGKKGREGETRVDSRLAATITEFLPQLSIADRAISAASALTGGRLDPLTTERGKERGLQNLVNLSGAAALGGFSAAQLTPGAITGEVSRRQEKQLAALVNAAGEKGVSLDWVRQQIRAGISPEEIAIMIGAGMGTVEEEMLSNTGGTVNDRYTAVMRGLQEGRVDTGY